MCWVSTKTSGSFRDIAFFLLVGLISLASGGYLGRQVLIGIVAMQGSPSAAIIESPASASFASMQTAGEVTSIGRGLLTLTQYDMIAFRRRNILGAYNKETDHSYYLSDVIKVKGYSDGFHTEVYWDATDDEPAEVITYYYEPEEGLEQWLKVLKEKTTKRKPESVSIPQQSTKEVIKERETVREIIKIRCRNCGEPYEERMNRCPYCNAPA
jgi:rubrerythrin